jgi:hypothetical protein
MSQLIYNIEKYISRKFARDQTSVILANLSLIFGLPISLSKSFIRSCFSYIYNKDLETQN